MKNQAQHLVLMLFFVFSILAFKAGMPRVVCFSDIFNSQTFADGGNFEGSGWVRTSVEGETGPYTLFCCSDPTCPFASLPLGIFLTNKVQRGANKPSKNPVGASMYFVTLSKYQTTPSPQRMKRD
jgi:hypothetical protein